MSYEMPAQADQTGASDLRYVTAWEGRCHTKLQSGMRFAVDVTRVRSNEA